MADDDLDLNEASEGLERLKREGEEGRPAATTSDLAEKEDALVLEDDDEFEVTAPAQQHQDKQEEEDAAIEDDEEEKKTEVENPVMPPSAAQEDLDLGVPGEVGEGRNEPGEEEAKSPREAAGDEEETVDDLVQSLADAQLQVEGAVAAKSPRDGTEEEDETADLEKPVSPPPQLSAPAGEEPSLPAGSAEFGQDDSLGLEAPEASQPAHTVGSKSLRDGTLEGDAQGEEDEFDETADLDKPVTPPPQFSKVEESLSVDAARGALDSEVGGKSPAALTERSPRPMVGAGDDEIAELEKPVTPPTHAVLSPEPGREPVAEDASEDENEVLGTVAVAPEEARGATPQEELPKDMVVVEELLPSEDEPQKASICPDVAIKSPARSPVVSPREAFATSPEVAVQKEPHGKPAEKFESPEVGEDKAEVVSHRRKATMAPRPAPEKRPSRDPPVRTSAKDQSLGYARPRVTVSAIPNPAVGKPAVDNKPRLNLCLKRFSGWPTLEEMNAKMQTKAAQQKPAQADSRLAASGRSQGFLQRTALSKLREEAHQSWVQEKSQKEETSRNHIWRPVGGAAVAKQPDATSAVPKASQAKPAGHYLAPVASTIIRQELSKLKLKRLESKPSFHFNQYARARPKESPRLSHVLGDSVDADEQVPARLLFKLIPNPSSVGMSTPPNVTKRRKRRSPPPAEPN